MKIEGMGLTKARDLGTVAEQKLRGEVRCSDKGEGPEGDLDTGDRSL